MRDVHDLIVIGGGPAGTAAAITAARLTSGSGRILLLERGSLPRQKVCGEFVSTESLALLRQLLSNSAVLDRAPQITSARLYNGSGAAIEISILPAAASIPRWELDEALWNSAKLLGIACRDRVEVTHLQRCAGEFVVSTAAGAFRSRSAIDASGRWSKLNCGNRPVRSDCIGLKAHFDVSKSEVVDGAHSIDTGASTDLYFFPGGYCGVQPVTPTRVNVCAMVASKRATYLNDVFRLHPALAQRSRRWFQATDQVTTAPLAFRRPCAERDGVLCAGDAAGFIDPFAGDGISIALRSGTLAANVLAPFWRGAITLSQAVREYRRAYQKCFAHAFRMAAIMRGALNAPDALRFLVWRALSLPHVAEFVVRTTR